MQLNYRTYGAPGAEAVLIVHGLLGAARNWQARAAALAAERFVVVPDLRNHGDSPWSGDIDFPTLADDLVALLDRLFVAKAHLIGHSLGGKCTMLFALTRPARCLSLQVVDIAPRRYTHGLGDFIRDLLDVPIGGAATRSDVERLLRPVVPDRAMRLFLTTNVARAGEGFAWKPNLAVLAANYPALSLGIDDLVAPEVVYEGPVQFLRGELSDYIVEDDREAIRRRFPRATLATVKGAGHWPHSDRPETFDALVAGFLRRASQ